MSHEHHHTQQDDDDFGPEDTGYKVGQKKTVDEYQELDAGDESLNRWKESLGLNSGKQSCYAFSHLFICVRPHALFASMNDPREFALFLTHFYM